MLNEKLDKYLKEDYYPFHMPGNKRSMSLRDDLGYKRDLSEIEGFDNLNDPCDIFIEMERKIAEIYKVKEAVISTNGSTCGIISTIRTLSLNNNKFLIQRSSHKSVYNAVEIFDLDVDFIDVKTNEINAVIGIAEDDLKNKIKEKNYSAVIVTSPSYEGYNLNLEEIYDICKQNDTKLILDMAHGSHQILDDSYSNSFDIAITSFHKNLSALTQTAAILINDNSLNVDIRRNMAMFQTSSPSYILLGSVDEMLLKFDNFYKLNYNLMENLKKLYELPLKHLKLVDESNKDRSKILISTLNTDIDGNILQKLLRDQKIEIEMASLNYALLISTIFDREEGFVRLKKALINIDESIKNKDNNYKFSYKIPKKAMSIRSAILKDKISLNINKAKGRICGEFIYAYPPGIPLLAPGEIIDISIIDNIKQLQKTGINLNMDESIEVIN